MCSDYEDLLAREAKTFVGSTLGSCSEFNNTEVISLKGECSFLCHKAYSYTPVTLRLFYFCEENTQIEISDGMNIKAFTLPTSGYDSIFAVKDIEFSMSGPARLTLKRIQGGFPKLKKLRIIFNNPKISMEIPVETTILEGSKLKKDLNGNWKICSLSNGDTIRINNICVNKPGKYIFRTHYIAGESGKAFISVNEGHEIEFSLSGGVSKWSSIKENDPMEHELLLEFRKKQNNILIRVQSSCPEIAKFELIEA